jgi:hypothetical protein
MCKGFCNRREKREPSELLAGAGPGPGSFETEKIAGLKPMGDLFDGGPFKIGRQGCLAGAGDCSREDIAAGVRHPGEKRGERGARGAQGNDARPADQEGNVCLLEPAVGFVFFELELGGRLDGVRRTQSGEAATKRKAQAGKRKMNLTVPQPVFGAPPKTVRAPGSWLFVLKLGA